MTAVSRGAVPTGESAIRRPSRPPIPEGDQTAVKPAGQQGNSGASTATVSPGDAPATESTSEKEVKSAASPASAWPSEPPAESAVEPPGERGAEATSEIASQIDSSTVSDDVAPPPAVQRVIRVQNNNKMRLDLLERMKAFTELHKSTLQAVQEAAVEEYMNRRGYTEEAHRKAMRRR